MKETVSEGPLQVFTKTSARQLGPGNLGVFIARAGVGKTALLIHLAIQKIFRDQRLIHVSLKEGPGKVHAYYEVICRDLIQSMETPQERTLHGLLEKNRMILAYLNQSFKMGRFRAYLRNLAEGSIFNPDVLIIDGLDFESAEGSLMVEFKDTAREFGLEMWFSALSHRHITEVSQEGIPYPCHRIAEFFSLIFHLQPTPSGILLRVLKNHDEPVDPEDSVLVDPNTFLLTKPAS